LRFFPRRESAPWLGCTYQGGDLRRESRCLGAFDHESADNRPRTNRSKGSQYRDSAALPSPTLGMSKAPPIGDISRRECAHTCSTVHLPRTHQSRRILSGFSILPFGCCHP